MAERIIKACMIFLYGKSVLDGYYTSLPSNKDEKNYIFSSIFPSQASMELALEQVATEN